MSVWRWRGWGGGLFQREGGGENAASIIHMQIRGLTLCQIWMRRNESGKAKGKKSRNGMEKKTRILKSNRPLETFSLKALNFVSGWQCTEASQLGLAATLSIKHD